ncbi:MAG: RNA polymerase sigma factor [Oscillospiraceae bacterium]
MERHPAPPAQSLLAFVCRVARNVSLNRYRHNHAQRRDESRNLPLVELEGCLAAPSAEETWSAQALGQTLDCFLDTLDRKSRVMFLRRYWFSDSVSWIARQMGITENHVSVQLHRIRSRLKQYLEQEGAV